MRSPVRRGAVGSLVALTLVACGGKHNVHLAPQPDVEMDPHVLAKFTEEVREYVHLRRKIVGTLPPAGSESTPEEIFERQHSMKVAIQEARRGAERGDFFKKSVEAAMRRIIQTEMQGPDKASMVKEIQQGNPKLEGVPTSANPRLEVKKDVVLRINGDYPDSAPLSSVPSSLLLKLPQLPEEVRYRFVGRHLILRDAEANVILDFIWDAIPDRSLPR